MNNEDKGYMTYCPRCGAEMNSNSRYCMKCGNLNSEHEANKSMKPYIKDNENSYQVGSGNFMNSNELQTSIGNNTGNKKKCFIINFTIYILLILLSAGLSIMKGIDIIVFRDSMFPILSICISISFLYIYSIELVFMKCNKPWWNGLIPIYNIMVLCDILYHKKWLGLLILVPVIGQIFMLVIFYSLGKSFKKNGIFTALFSFIYIPIIGFGTSLFKDHSFVDSFDQKEVEKNYKRKKIFLFFIFLFLLVGIGLIIWKNSDSVTAGKEIIGDSYYIYAAKRIVKKTEKEIGNGKINCDNGEYFENSGIYYFIYNDLGDYVYLPLYYQRDPIKGYVKVDNSTGISHYYVSLTDGEKGFGEIETINLDVDFITNYSELNNIDENSNVICYFK